MYCLCRLSGGKNGVIMSIIYSNIASLIGAFFCYQIIASFMVISEKRIRKIAIIVACFLLIGMVIYMGDWGNMPPTFVIFVLVLIWACEGSLKKKITLAIIISNAPFALSCLADTFLRGYGNNLNDLPIAITKLLFWLLLWFLVKRIAIENTFELPGRYWNILILLACTPFLTLLAIILIPQIDEPIGPTVTATLICILIIVIMSVIGLLFAVYALYKAARIEESKLILEVNEAYYQNLDSQMFQIRKLRHDMANHLQVISNLPPEGIGSYVNNLLNDKAMVKPLVFCRDSVLNAVLSSKADLMDKESILFDYEISLDEDIPLSDTDKCALLGNLLDNAVEGSRKINDERRITLRVSCNKGLFIVNIKNSCDRDMTDSLETTKKDKANHGLGLKSIDDVVKRHGGSIELQRTDGIFEVFIVINMTA